MKHMIDSNPLEFEGLRQPLKVQQTVAQLRSITTDHEFVQAPLAQLPSGQNKKRPPLTMEPSIDDPLAAVNGIMRCAYFSVNQSDKCLGMHP